MPEAMQRHNAYIYDADSPDFGNFVEQIVQVLAQL